MLKLTLEFQTQKDFLQLVLLIVFVYLLRGSKCYDIAVFKKKIKVGTQQTQIYGFQMARCWQ